MLRETQIKRTLITLTQGDLTVQEVDAIVNAANSHLQHGGGVAGAIVRAGGQIIQEESDKIGYTPTGSAAITSAGRLPAKHVIHAVGPIWGEGDEDRKLYSAVQSSLALAEKHKLRSIALPAISSGIFGFPKDRCAQVILSAIIDYLEEKDSSLEEVRITLIDQPTLHHFEAEFDKRFKPA